jgi:hypothetical protein
MPTPTYIPLANVTLGSSASSVTFSSIPTTGYRDLVLVFWAKRASGESNVSTSFNDNTTNFSRIYMYGTGSAAFAGSETTRELGFSSAEGALNIINIMDYSATDKHKIALTRWNFAGAYVLQQVTRWADTAAVNKIVLTDSAGGTFAATSTFALYGIAS